MIRSHAILRTRIIQSTSQAFQVVVNDEPRWQSSLALDEYKKQDNDTTMSYGNPLVRYCLIRGQTSVSDSFFVYTSHHAVYDAFSDASLFGAIESFYIHGTTNFLDVPQYNKFIQFLQKTDIADSNKFWQAQLSGGSPASFPQIISPTFEPRPTKIISRKIDLPRTGSTFTLPTLLRGAWAVVLGQYSDSEDVIFDQVLSGRSAPMENIASMIGPTLCTVPIRVRMDKTKKVENFLSDIQVQAIDMIPFEQAGIQNIRRLPGIDVVSRPGNLFVIQPTITANTSSPLGMQIVPTVNKDFETYALLVECLVSDSGPVELRVKFDETVISEVEVFWLLTHFETATRNLHSNLLLPLSAISLFSEKDRNQIAQWVGPPVSMFEACVHDLVRTQADLVPSKLAICAWDGDFTYSQLDSMSTLLSSHLRRLGVQQKSLVCLCFEKSAWAIVSMLAVLNCGAAIVMLSPQHPATRLKEIVEETETKVILTGIREAAIIQGLADSVLAIDRRLMDQIKTEPNLERLLVRPSSPVYVVFTSGSKITLLLSPEILSSALISTKIRMIDKLTTFLEKVLENPKE